MRKIIQPLWVALVTGENDESYNQRPARAYGD
jgi:hypothetical protein